MSKTTRQTFRKSGKRIARPRSRSLSLPSDRVLAAVVYGPSGVGKTSFAANFPEVGFLIDNQEEGILNLMAYGQAPKVPVLATVDTWEGCLDVLGNQVIGSGIKTLAIDSLTGIERLCFAWHCEEYFDGNWSSKGFYSYQQGPRNAAKRTWPEFIDALDVLRGNGINIILIAHSTTRPEPNPGGSDYLKFTPYLDKETWAAIHRWAGCVLFYKMEFAVNTKGPRAKAEEDSQRRVIYTEQSPICDAKNQFGLEPVINAGESGKEAFDNFWDAFQKVIPK